MTRRSWLLMAGLAALWGASYLFIKVALEDGVPPVFLVFARLALGALVLVPLALPERALHAVAAHWRAILFMAVIQVVTPFLLIAFGQRHVASSLAGILVASAPIFTALIAARYDVEERPHGIAIAGVVVGLVGVVLLFGVDLRGDAKALAGGLMIVLAALGYAVGSLYLKHRLRAMPPIGVAAATIALGALLTAPAVPFALPSRAPSVEGVAALIALGAGSSGVGFWIFYTLIRDVGPGRASLVAYIAPGFAVVYGVTLLSESITAAAILGLVLILGGSWVAAEGRWPGQAKATTIAPLEPPPAREPA
ncbi:MAG TPA: DMT family transporter [Solirubrobacteraceae bacterium]|nr:DMT family transporter [Solirubrobacteraceae bacterium]